MFRPLAACAAVLLALSTLSACAPVIVGGAAAGAGVSAAQERGMGGAVDDAKIRAEINHLWLQHDHKMYVDVGLTITEGRVLLTGKVEKPETRVDAVRLAWQAAGVREVINEIQVTDQSSLMDYGRDVIIANTLRSKLLLDSEVKSINYSVDVVNRVVYLMGIAQDAAELERVIAHARNISYVNRVISYVVLKDDPRRHTS